MTTTTTPCLWMLIGPSGAGKSTLAESVANEHMVVVSTDAVRKKLFGSEEDQQHGEIVFEKCAQYAADLMDIHGVDVLFDATNTTAKGRKRFLKMVRKRMWNSFRTAALLFVPDVEVAKYRNGLRSRHVPEEVIDRQFDQLWRDIDTIQDQFDAVYFMDSQK